MDGLEDAIQELRGLIAAPCFVRRDRLGRALFVSDYPVRSNPETRREIESRLLKNGFTVTGDGMPALIDWEFSRYESFFGMLEALAQDAPEPASPRAGSMCLALSLHESPVLPGMLPILRRMLLLWDAGDETALLREIGRTLAVALRRKEPVPSCLTALLLNIQQPGGVRTC